MLEMLPAATHAQEARLKVFKVFSPVMQVGQLAKLVTFYNTHFSVLLLFFGGGSFFFVSLAHVCK